MSEAVALIRKIRNKVHAHNRGGGLRAGVRDEIRDLCDEFLAKDAKP